MKKSLFLRCPKDLKEKLKRVAAQTGVSLNALIVFALQEFADKKCA